MKKLTQYTLQYGQEEIPVTIIYSKRRSLGLQVKGDKSVYARVPNGVSRGTVEQFITNNQNWIIKKWLKYSQPEMSGVVFLDAVTGAQEKKKARELITGRVAYYGAIMGVSPGRISMRNQKTRWGSCSSQGNLNFNNRLLFVPMELVDYVVVHELCHLRHMNHSRNFWGEVEKYLPDYRVRRQQLNKYGFR